MIEFLWVFLAVLRFLITIKFTSCQLLGKSFQRDADRLERYCNAKELRMESRKRKIAAEKTRVRNVSPS